MSEANPITPDPQDFLIDDIIGIDRDALETDRKPESKVHRISPKRRYARITQKQSLNDVIGSPPAIGESIHVISASKFDFWTWVPAMVDWLDVIDELYCSTWTLCRQNAKDLMELCDSGKVPRGKVSFLTGLYFKRRETAVYTALLNGIRERGGRYRAFLNHAKVILMSNAEKNTWLSIEGSANLTSNPRLEQSAITNDKGLYAFHRGWFEEMLADG